MNRTTYIFAPNTLLMVVHNSNWCWWTTVIVLAEVYSYVRSPYRNLFVYDSVVQVCHFVLLWIFTNTNKLVWTSAQHISTTWANAWGVKADAQRVVSPRGADFRLTCIWAARNFLKQQSLGDTNNQVESTPRPLTHDRLSHRHCKLNLHPSNISLDCQRQEPAASFSGSWCNENFGREYWRTIHLSEGKREGGPYICQFIV